MELLVEDDTSQTQRADAFDAAMQAPSDPTTGQPSSTQTFQCPGGCHEPTGGTDFSNYRYPRFLPHAPTLQQHIGKVGSAATSEQHQAVISGFDWATSQLDRVATLRHATQEQYEQLQYFSGLHERQQQLQSEMSNGEVVVNIPAIYYPEDDWTTNQSSGQREAKGIPWQFYLSYPPIIGTRWPSNFKWTLHDITNRGRPKVDQHGPSNLAKILMNDPENSAKNPPYKLFEKLNHKERFMKGVLYLRLPNGVYTQRMTEPWSFGDWLRAVGLTIAAIALILGTAGAATPGVIAALGISAAAFSIAGTASDLYEQSQRGTLTEGQINRAALSIAIDLASAATLGLGRIVATSARAASVAGQASRSQRLWFAAQSVATGLDAVNLGVVTYDFYQQYQAIQNQNFGSQAEKDRALRQLILQGLLSGGLSTISLQSNARDMIRGGATLRLHTDTQGRTTALPEGASPDSAIQMRGSGELHAPDAVPTAAQSRAANDIIEQVPPEFARMDLSRLRRHAASDTRAAEALRLRYRALDDATLALHRSDPIAADVIASRTGYAPSASTSRTNYDEWAGSLSNDTRRTLGRSEGSRRMWGEMDPQVRRVLTKCASPCIPDDAIVQAADLTKLRETLDTLGVPGNHPGLRAYFHARRDDLARAIFDLHHVAGRNINLDDFLRNAPAVQPGAAGATRQLTARYRTSDGYEIVETTLVKEFTGAPANLRDTPAGQTADAQARATHNAAAGGTDGQRQQAGHKQAAQWGPGVGETVVGAASDPRNFSSQAWNMNIGGEWRAMEQAVTDYRAANPNTYLTIAETTRTSTSRWGTRDTARSMRIVDQAGNTPPELAQWTSDQGNLLFLNPRPTRPPWLNR